MSYEELYARAKQAFTMPWADQATASVYAQTNGVGDTAPGAMRPSDIISATANQPVQEILAPTSTWVAPDQNWQSNISTALPPGANYGTYAAQKYGAGGSGGSGGGIQFNGKQGAQGEWTTTNYHPGVGDSSMEGGFGTASGGSIIKDDSAPLGYRVQYRGKSYDYSIAVPRSMRGMLGKTMTIGGISFLVADVYGGKAHGNSADILASPAAFSALQSRWRSGGYYVNSNGSNGYSSGQAVIRSSLPTAPKPGLKSSPSPSRQVLG